MNNLSIKLSRSDYISIILRLQIFFFFLFSSPFFFCVPKIMQENSLGFRRFIRHCTSTLHIIQPRL